MAVKDGWPILRCQGPHSWYETYDIPDEVLFGWIDAETPPDRQPQLNQWKRDYVTQIDVTQIGGLIRRHWQEAQQYRVS